MVAKQQGPAATPLTLVPGRWYAVTTAWGERFTGSFFAVDRTGPAERALFTVPRGGGTEQRAVAAGRIASCDEIEAPDLTAEHRFYERTGPKGERGFRHLSAVGRWSQRRSGRMGTTGDDEIAEEEHASPADARAVLARGPGSGGWVPVSYPPSIARAGIALVRSDDLELSEEDAAALGLPVRLPPVAAEGAAVGALDPAWPAFARSGTPAALVVPGGGAAPLLVGRVDGRSGGPLLDAQRRVLAWLDPAGSPLDGLIAEGTWTGGPTPRDVRLVLDDLVRFDGLDVRDRAWQERRALLAELAGRLDAIPAVSGPTALLTIDAAPPTVAALASAGTATGWVEVRRPDAPYGRGRWLLEADRLGEARGASAGEASGDGPEPASDPEAELDRLAALVAIAREARVAGTAADATPAPDVPSPFGDPPAALADPAWQETALTAAERDRAGLMSPRLHARWDPAGCLQVWGELPAAPGAPDGLHPGSAGPAAVRRALGRLLADLDGDPLAADAGVPVLAPVLLPVADDGPLPADGEAVAAGELGWTGVATLAFDTPSALSVLAPLAGASVAAVSPTLHAFARIALFALELVARGRLVPRLERPPDAAGDRPAAEPTPAGVQRFAADDGRRIARWVAAPGAADADRMATLARALPAACAADGGLTDPGWADRLLRSVLDASIDAIARRVPADPPPARALLRALTSSEDVMPLAARTAAHLDRWRASVSPGDAPLVVTLRLAEPDDDGAGAPWRLSVLVAPRADRSLLLPAPAARGDAALAALVPGTGDAILAEVGRAAALYPPLAAFLDAAFPDTLELAPGDALAFLRDGSVLLADAGFGIQLPAALGSRSRLSLRLRVRSDTTAAVGSDGLVAFDWRAALGEHELSLEELRALAAARVPLLRVRGRWLELGRGELEAAIALVERGTVQGTGGDVVALARAAAGLDPTLAGLRVDRVDATGWAADLLEGRLDDDRIVPLRAPDGFSGTLRPYQERGLGWLAFLDRHGLGGCLADDMGLGKTPQIIAFLVAEREGPVAVGPTLIVCPTAGVVRNWGRELGRFAPGLAVHIHHGPGRERDPEALQALAGARDVVLTTYATAVRDHGLLAGVDWRRVVLDEAQAVKNRDTATAAAVRVPPARTRLAVTGTPVENRLSELWSVLDFAVPGLLGSQRRFGERFATPIERDEDEAAAERLRRLVGPFILRRTKTDRRIIDDLPEKILHRVDTPLTREQAALYQAVLDEEFSAIEAADRAGDDRARRGRVFRLIHATKRICDHPVVHLRDGSPLAGRSGKLTELERLLDGIVASGDAALVFTQYVDIWADRLVPYLATRLGRDVLYYRGGRAAAVNEAIADRFQAGASPVMVVSLKAGGTGINLTAANHVIHYDRWWNPAVEDQATDRAYRIGQQRNVEVHTFVTPGTIEERIADMLEAKRELADRIVTAGEEWIGDLSTQELRALFALADDAVGDD